ncbi:MAG: GDP-mannose 4,6-dehydratase [Bacteroidota bacterium]
MNTALITGITGQDGAYLSQLLLSKGYTVIGFIRSYNSRNFSKLNYLGIQDKIIFEECDLMDLSNVMRLLKKYNPDEIYNLSAQSSVSLSFDQPITTLNFNIVSVANILEAIRYTNPLIKLYQASSSEMYGRVETLPIRESTPFHPLSPYAVSKASAHWIAVNYRESYNLFVCCGVLFNHESFLRSKNFFVKKVIRESIEIAQGKRTFLKVGNIDIKRDYGYSPDYVEAMWLMLQKDAPTDYMICSGSSVSLRQIIEYVFKRFEISLDKLNIDQVNFRPNEIFDIYGDNSKAKAELNWNSTKSMEEILDLIINEEIANYDKFDVE